MDHIIQIYSTKKQLKKYHKCFPGGWDLPFFSAQTSIGEIWRVRRNLCLFAADIWLTTESQGEVFDQKNLWPNGLSARMLVIQNNSGATGMATVSTLKHQFELIPINSTSKMWPVSTISLQGTLKAWICFKEGLHLLLIAWRGFSQEQVHNDQFLRPPRLQLLILQRTLQARSTWRTIP